MQSTSFRFGESSIVWTFFPRCKGRAFLGLSVHGWPSGHDSIGSIGAIDSIGSIRAVVLLALVSCHLSAFQYLRWLSLSFCFLFLVVCSPQQANGNHHHQSRVGELTGELTVELKSAEERLQVQLPV